MGQKVCSSIFIYNTMWKYKSGKPYNTCNLLDTGPRCSKAENHCTVFCYRSLMFSLGLLIYGDWFSSKVSFSHLVNIVGVAFCVSLELWKLETGVILHICHESHENSRVNFYRFNAKNWQFTVYFVVISAFFRCRFYSPKILLV